MKRTTNFITEIRWDYFNGDSIKRFAILIKMDGSLNDEFYSRKGRDGATVTRTYMSYAAATRAVQYLYRVVERNAS